MKGPNTYLILSQHTSAALTINENYDSGQCRAINSTFSGLNHTLDYATDVRRGTMSLPYHDDRLT